MTFSEILSKEIKQYGKSRGTGCDEETREMDTHDSGWRTSDNQLLSEREKPNKFQAILPTQDYQQQLTLFDKISNVKVLGYIEMRYLLVPLYALMALLLGVLYWGWAGGFRDLLSREEAYIWKCYPQPLEIHPGNKYGAYQAQCKAQVVAIGNLLTICVSSHMIFSSFSGILLDRTNPRFTFLIASSVKALGWVLLIVSQKNFQAYIPAFILIGASVDCSYLPLVSAACALFKIQGTSVVVSILGSGMSASSVIPVIFFAIGKASDRFDTTKGGDDDDDNDAGVRLWQFGVAYIGIVIAGTSILSLFVVPSRRDHYNRQQETNEQDLELFRETKYQITIMKPVAATTSQGLNHAISGSVVGTSDKDVNDESTSKNLIVIKKWWKDMLHKTEDFRKCLFSSSYYLYIPFLTILVLRSLFMSLSTGDQLHESVDSLWADMRPFTFVPCICFGFLFDFGGIFIGTFVLNLLGTLIFLLVLGKYLATQYLTICVFFIYCSFCMSSLFAYLQKTQPRRHFGKLAGIANTVGGLFQLMALPFYEISKDTLEDFLPMNLVMLGLSVVNLFIWFWLYYVWRKSCKMTKSMLKELDKSEPTIKQAIVG